MRTNSDLRMKDWPSAWSAPIDAARVRVEVVVDMECRISFLSAESRQASVVSVRRYGASMASESLSGLRGSLLGWTLAGEGRRTGWARYGLRG